MIIAVASGKGGAGKTFVSCSLAKELSKKYKVLLADADCECPNARIFFPEAKLKEEKTVKTFYSELSPELCNKCNACVQACRKHAIIAGKDKYPVIFQDLCNACGACFIVCKQNALRKKFRDMGKVREFVISENFSLLEGELFPGEEESIPVLRELWKKIKENLNNYDFVIVDSPPGVRCNALFCMEKSDFVLLVAEASEFGVSDALRVAEACELLQKNFFVVMNKVGENAKEFPEREKIIQKVPFSQEVLKNYAEGRLPSVEEIKAIASFIGERYEKGSDS